jgi:glycosyltransferase involved in cell wall biosynthesis
VLPSQEGFSPDAAGAIALLVQRLARRTAHPVTVLGPARPEPPFAEVAFHPIALRRWPAATQRRRYGTAAAQALAAMAPALIEVHNRPDLALDLAARFRSVPVALFLHNDPQGMRGARTPSERAALLGRMARVVTVSAWLRDRLLEGVPGAARPPVVLANCLELAALPPRAPPAGRAPLLLFAGRVVRDKGADAFVEACARALPRLPGWRAEMIGADRFSHTSPETPFLRRLRPRAAAAGVTLAGYRPHAAVLEAMATAAIVAVPSRWPEPFGLTALEAMASGAALVCSDRGALPEVAGEAALIADPDDPAALANAFCTLAADPARRGVLAEAGLARARRFDVAHAAAALDALRSELLGR